MTLPANLNGASLIRDRNDRARSAVKPGISGELSRIHNPTQIANARGAGNPARRESDHYSRTEKRTSAHA